MNYKTPKEKEQESLRFALDERYHKVVDAVSGATRSGFHYRGLAQAIVVGLFESPDQKKVIADIARELLEHTGEPYKVDNLADRE